MSPTLRQQLDVKALADQCLGYLAESPDELLRFLETAGLNPAALRASLQSNGLQRGLIDYFASNEPLLLTFCANAGISPEAFMRVWHKLNPAG